MRHECFYESVNSTVDSITHVALGAIVGEAIAGKKVGKRALFFGAIAQSFPDIDFIASFWLSPADNLLAHRGITHSIFFAVLATIIFAVISERYHRPQKVSLREWMVFYAVEIALHLALDVCNAYGIGLLEPINNTRFSFHLLFVADPFFSIWLFIGLGALMMLDSKNPSRRKWIYFSLIISSAYFLHAITNKLKINRTIRAALNSQHITYDRILSTPTPLNSWLWFVAAESKSGFYTTHLSTWDPSNKSVDLTFHPRQDSLLLPYIDDHDTKELIRFSQGFYTVERWDTAVVFNDLRFGQVAGWKDPKTKFVFHYYLNDPEVNLLVIQRGRFSNWDKETFGSFINRIRGN
jgi:inner membrane protein